MKKAVLCLELFSIVLLAVYCFIFLINLLTGFVMWDSSWFINCFWALVLVQNYASGVRLLIAIWFLCSIAISFHLSD